MKPTFILPLAEENNIPFVSDFHVTKSEEGVDREACSEERIFDIIFNYGKTFKKDLILYGGQVASEKIYGLKGIRDISTDIDYVCSFDGINKIIKSKNLYYHTIYDIVFLVKNRITVTFTYKHIHDWKVDNGFFKNSEIIDYNGYSFYVCSAEYILMLKIRRMISNRENCIDVFGKDALDIINIISSSDNKKNVKQIDYSFLKVLIKKYVSNDKTVLKGIYDFIQRYFGHLTDSEMAASEKSFNNFKKSLYY